MSKPLLLGLIGHPLSHSLSPKLHGAALKYANLEGEYRLFDVESDDLETKLKALITSGLNGFNVTIPHKVPIFKQAQKLSEDAILVGAVNTVRIEEDHSLTGHNTDANGLLEAVREVARADLTGKSALLIGCGGSAQAVLKVGCDLRLGRIDVVGRDRSKVEDFISRAQKRFSLSKNELERSFGERITSFEPDSCQHQIVFHTTPIGLKPDDTVPEWMANLVTPLPKDAIILDLVYHKDLSLPAFAKLTRGLGLTTADGINMLIHQARLAFEFWTDISVPPEIMKAALKQA